MSRIVRSWPGQGNGPAKKHSFAEAFLLLFGPPLSESQLGELNWKSAKEFELTIKGKEGPLTGGVVKLEDQLLSLVH